MINRRNVDYPECPQCGSDDAARISGAVLPDDSYDPKASGTFRCGHCRTEYQFLKPVEPETKEQVFSPTAQCPSCKSFKTKAVKTDVVRRYHICLNKTCGKSFRTLRPTNERRSRQEASPIQRRLDNR